MDNIKTALTATFIWFCYAWIMIFIWGYIAMYSPLPNWVIEHLLPLGEWQMPLFIFVTDTLINILLLLPLVFALIKLPLTLKWQDILIAAIVVFLWQYQTALSDLFVLKNLFSMDNAIFGAATTLALLPIAYFLSTRWQRRTNETTAT